MVKAKKEEKRGEVNELDFFRVKQPSGQLSSAVLSA